MDMMNMEEFVDGINRVYLFGSSWSEFAVSMLSFDCKGLRNLVDLSTATWLSV